MFGTSFWYGREDCWPSYFDKILQNQFHPLREALCIRRTNRVLPPPPKYIFIYMGRWLLIYIHILQIFPNSTPARWLPRTPASSSRPPHSPTLLSRSDPFTGWVTSIYAVSPVCRFYSPGWALRHRWSRLCAVCPCLSIGGLYRWSEKNSGAWLCVVLVTSEMKRTDFNVWTNRFWRVVWNTPRSVYRAASWGGTLQAVWRVVDSLIIFVTYISVIFFFFI